MFCTLCDQKVLICNKGNALCHVRPGVMAGKAAGMNVVAVPSLPKQSHLYTSADEVINSLLDLRPEKWGLPPFQDCKHLLPFRPHSDNVVSVSTFSSKLLF